MKYSAKIPGALLAIISIGLSTACTDTSTNEQSSIAKSEFAGSSSCQGCHTSQFDDWIGSHHELAMQVANDTSVLGDFSNSDIDYFGNKTEFDTKDGVFVVRTADSNGELREFEVTHTFGISPLQQYLVDFSGGRKQVLPFAWDTRSPDLGGQRWYHLYPDEYIGPDDPLHWTGRYFNWNFMCAECHSTDVELGYDFGSDTFTTTFEEISVGCEACHGPGSLHVEQADRGEFDDAFGLRVDLVDRRDAAWTMNPDTGIATRSKHVENLQQPESCGRCHARRTVLTPEYEYNKPLTDTHMPSLLEENLYYADGQIQDEVYVYGSFIQSKMYAAGVTCSDCHNPHSGGLHTGQDPNQICVQCHAPARFAATDHGSADVGNCVDCHMRARIYMGVDDRRDHSFRIPDASRSESHFGTAIASGRNGAANASLNEALLNGGHPAIVRATMLTLLQTPLSEEDAAIVLDSLNDADPIVRIAALRTMRQLPPTVRMQAGSHLLRDSVRGVRVEAALTYVEYRDLLPVEDARAFNSAANEYRTALTTALSMPGAALGLAEFESQSGNATAAEKHYRRALALDPDLGAAHHAYGLFLVRGGQNDRALLHLRKAARLDPGNGRYAYVLGVALNSLGFYEEAITELANARDNFETDFDIAWALATMYRDAGDVSSARRIANALAQQFPDDQNVRALLAQLESR